MINARDIIAAALEAKTYDEAEKVQQMIAADVGARYQRPVGDRWNNHGLLATGGSYEYKVLEPVTNMQDAVLERLAAGRFGPDARVPYETPEGAAAELLGGLNYREAADKNLVVFHESDPPAGTSKRLTVTYRDLGCGMEPQYLRRSVFALGSEHKTKASWQQGAFGLGGATTFLNAKAVVLVTRPAPEIRPTKDRISVAVVMWEDHGKGRSAYYLTTDNWDDGSAPNAEPWSAPASEFPDFEPGTQLSLISYGVERYHRGRLGDERSFDTVLNTRLFEPVMPVAFTNSLVRAERREYLRGLRRRLEDNPREEREEGRETLPYNIGGETYHLPVSYYVFSARGESGERRKFVAKDHAVAFTSNGQVHHHWKPQEFKNRTKLNKLYDRILVVVETDELPIRVRTALFTADRSQLLASDDAIRLEGQVAGFLNEWDALKEINKRLIRDAVRRADGSGATADIAAKIGRLLNARGFSTNGTGTGGSGPGSVGPRPPRPPIELYRDPTTLEGPGHVHAAVGETKFVGYVLNAQDGFVPRRGRLEVSCDHPEINAREISVGELRGGRIRVSVAVPEGVETGDYTLDVSLSGWLRSSGGLGSTLRTSTALSVVDEIPSRPRGGGPSTSASGNDVALIWDTHENRVGDGWHAGVPGEVQPTPASVLAERDDYAALAALGDTEIPTIVLNSEYSELKRYLSARARTLRDEGVKAAQNRYAEGTGLGLLYLYREFEKEEEKGVEIDERVKLHARQALARSTLAIMPEFDRLAEESGVE